MQRLINCVLGNLLQDGHLLPVEQLPGVEHGEEVELGVGGDGGLQPGGVGGAALLHHHLLGVGTFQGGQFLSQYEDSLSLVSMKRVSPNSRVAVSQIGGR